MDAIDVTPRGITPHNRRAHEPAESQNDWLSLNVVDRYAAGKMRNTGTISIDQVAKALLQGKDCSVLWTEMMNGCIFSSGICVGDNGTLFHGNSDGNFYAMDGKTGDIKWKSPIVMGTMYSAPVKSDDGTVFIHSCAGHIYGFDADTGTVRCKVEPAELSGWNMTHQPPAITREGLLISNSRERLGAYDAKTLAKIWEYPTSKNLCGVETGKDGNVYFGDGNGKLVALDGKTGRKIWERPFEHSTRMIPRLAGDGSLYATSFGSVDKINAGTGATEWQAGCAGWAVGKPYVDEEGTVFFGDDGGWLRAVDGATGKQKWEFKAGSCVITSPVIDKNGSLYFTSYDGNLYCIDSKTGCKKWILDVEGKEDRPRQPVIAHDGTVYLAVDEYHIKAVKSREFMVEEIIDGGVNEPGFQKPEVEECGDYVVIDGMKLDINNDATGQSQAA